MAGASLLTLLDDIATLLDDVSVLSKVALKKTTGVLGDDLALNAEQVSGVKAERELPVVWAVAKGSFVNKLILVPSALLISALFPWLITPLLMIGGAYLCYEGTEKVLHGLFHREQQANDNELLKKAFHDQQIDMRDFEANKIKGAIRTDFILSAEIIVIALGTVQDASLLKQSLVLSAIALAITVFIYGLVAGIVKLDDAGIAWMKYRGQSLSHRLRFLIGRGLLWFAPKLMKFLTLAGTIAMFLVGGGILIHGLHFVAVWLDMFIEWVGNAINLSQYLAPVVRLLLVMISGFVAGLILMPLVSLAGRVKNLVSAS